MVERISLSAAEAATEGAPAIQWRVGRGHQDVS
jgi:hypothetical protein